MADQENNNKEELDNLDPILDEDSFSLDLDDFDLGDDDLEESPGLEPPSLDDVNEFEEEDDSSISELVLSSSDTDDDDLLDIDLDSDLNLLGEEDPVLHDDDIDNNFMEVDDKKQSPTPMHTEEDDLELEFDDDVIDLDQEIEAILNGADGILTNKNKTLTNNPQASSDFSTEEEDEGPIALSMEELENITGGLLGDDETLLEDETSDLDNEDVMLPEDGEMESDLESMDDVDHDLHDDHTDLDLDLDETEVDTEISFDEKGVPDLDLEDEDAKEISNENDTFTPVRDPEEEELFGSPKEDENLTMSDDELGNILGSSSESLEEALGHEDDFLETEELPEIDLASSEMPEEDDDGPITLSLEELDNIGSMDEPEVNILDEELEDETITLSPDELGSIVASDEFETEDETAMEDDDSSDDLSFDVFGDEVIEEDETNLESDSDLDSEADGKDTSSGLEGEYEEFQNNDLSPTEDDEGPLALSMEELESIAGEAEESSDEELVDSLDRAPLPYEEEKGKSDSFEEDLEDESIALSMEELENITSGEDADTIDEDAGFASASDIETEPEIEEINFDAEQEPQAEEEPEIETVSGDKIDDLLGEEIPGDDLEDIADLPMEEEEFSLGDAPDLAKHDELIEFSDTDVSSEIKEPTLAHDDSVGVELDLDEYAPEGKLSPLEELRASSEPAESEKSLSAAAEEAIKDSGSELSVVDRKKVLGYLDNLLGNLPDEVIKEFSKSQYFDLYKKLMKELEL
jgi:pilus assembly protein FimV